MANGKKYHVPVQFASDVLLSAQTASRVAVFDASKNLISSSVTSTELGYLSGVSSAIQTQINSKQADVITTEGDLVIGNGSGEAARLAIGSDTQVLTSNGTTVSWVTPVTTDEKIKCSSNDSVTAYLEDKIVLSAGSNSSAVLELSTLNDGADEDVQIQFDVSKVDHDSALNFVADEHVAHSGVSIGTAADSGLSGGGDISSSRNLVVDIAGTTEESSVANDDELLIQDTSAGALKSMSRSNFFGPALPSSGDIKETSFAAANNQSSAADITGFAFANADVRAFKGYLSVFIDADSDLYEMFEIEGIQKGASWDIAYSSVGDDAGITLSISAAGQLAYQSTDIAGWSSSAMRFRAISLSL